MSRCILLALMLVVCISSTPVRAQAWANAEALISACNHAVRGTDIKGPNLMTTNTNMPIEGYECLGIVSAVQALSVILIDGHTLTNLCLPPETTLSQLVRVVADYGNRHPEKLHEQNVGLFTVNALADAFTCP